jgi:hypothetical protein
LDLVALKNKRRGWLTLAGTAQIGKYKKSIRQVGSSEFLATILTKDSQKGFDPAKCYL